MSTILIVDDREANREFLLTLLAYQGHRLLQARDGAEALDVVRREHCDLVITDILMPSMDGYELVRRLRAEPAIASTKVMFYTAHYREEQAKTLAEACGVQHVLIKPCEPEQMLRAVELLLGAPASASLAPTWNEFDQEHLRLVTDKVSQKAAELRIANKRLTVLIQIDLQLASERDPARLIERLCESARELVGARYALAGAGNRPDVQPRHFAVSGMDAHTGSLIDPPVLGHGIPGEVLHARQARRLARLAGGPSAVGLPAQHPSFDSFLCAPVTSPAQTYGWVCVTGKVGGPEFSEEDEHLLVMLAALVGRIYENGSLYADIRRHADRLESEISERKRAEAEMRLLNADLEHRVRESATRLEAMMRGPSTAGTNQD